MEEKVDETKKSESVSTSEGKMKNKMLVMLVLLVSFNAALASLVTILVSLVILVQLAFQVC